MKMDKGAAKNTKVRKGTVTQNIIKQRTDEHTKNPPRYSLSSTVLNGGVYSSPTPQIRHEMFSIPTLNSLSNSRDDAYSPNIGPVQAHSTTLRFSEDTCSATLRFSPDRNSKTLPSSDILSSTTLAYHNDPRSPTIKSEGEASSAPHPLLKISELPPSLRRATPSVQCTS